MKELRELWDKMQADDDYRMEVILLIGVDAVESIRLAVKASHE